VAVTVLTRQSVIYHYILDSDTRDIKKIKTEVSVC